MAELLVRIADKVNSDFYMNTKCTKRGDVIVASPDGWPWGKEELSLPFYRIFKIPALPLAEAQALCAPELDTDPAHPSRTLQRRAFRLDIDNVIIPAALKAFLLDNTRANPTFTVNLTLAQIRSLKIVKPVIADPAIIGASPNIF
jgi:hypothetical protein